MLRPHVLEKGGVKDFGSWQTWPQLAAWNVLYCSLRVCVNLCGFSACASTFLIGRDEHRARSRLPLPRGIL